jgi:hypothetical protein
LSTAVLDNKVSVEKLAKGNYVILLEDANGKTFTQKFIKE